MNLTLSLAINGGGTSGTTKKRKLLRDSVVVDDVMSCDGGDHSRVARLLQARERMMARLEADDTRVAAAAPDDGSAGSLRLMHLLLSSVAAAESGDAHAAAAALHEVYRRASFRGGDPAQRVAAYFADALASSRLVIRSPSPAAAAAAAAASPSPSPPTRAERFLAYTMFYQASPIYQLAHFTANQAIVEAFESGGRRRLHVVDFDVSYGFQWPSLIQSMSHAAASTSTSTCTTSSSSHDGGDGDCAEPPVSLRITGLGTNPDELRQTEARLARFASGCPNLRFEFEGIVVVDDDGPDSGRRHERIKVDDDATVVVNLVFPAAAAHQSSTTTSTRDEACSSALARIRSLNPSLVFLVEKDGGGNATSRGRRSSIVLPPFTASLRYFAAVFDSLHECLPADSAERLAIERNHLGAEISDAMASLADYNNNYGGGGDDHHMVELPTTSCWRQMMERAGFERVELSSRTVSQAKLLLKMKSGGGGGFRVMMEGEGGSSAMSLGWRDSVQLITATGWRRRRRSTNKPAFS
ncbi:scarecrow-like protein 23 [Sorghum bicolor]|nr:scarecrow-like protein 23 [Sorghum bicolor]|eukprot:XP_021318456.1 scarecrow-like protein 23 [Sorghum bicolor]